ncbi:MAG: transglycosylase family protein [Herbiconiux sp.]|nr:transglycosylase family protein [Herbiconiux sp.]
MASSSPPDRRSNRRRAAVVLVAGTTAPLLLWGGVPLGAGAQDQGSLEKRIEGSKATESKLRTSAARLARLEEIAQRGIAVLEKRQGEAQADLERWQNKLATTETRLGESRKRLADQQRRLENDRDVLAKNLRAAYVGGPRPDLVTVLVTSKGVSEALERVDYEASARNANTRILDNVKDAKRQTTKIERSLQKVVPQQREATEAVRRERDAVAQRTAALAERRSALAQARAARLSAIKATRKDRARANRTLTRLIAAQKKAAVNVSGPGGPWAIPWAIVQCESGGQNLPPNSATASGYYQFIDSTWQGLGGSTPQAYKASKAEQDRLAAKLWAGGSGASNWDCAAIVGLI